MVVLGRDRVTLDEGGRDVSGKMLVGLVVIMILTLVGISAQGSLDIVGVISNPVILGMLTFVFSWLIREFGWQVEGKQAMWLTMGVALVLALLGSILSGGIRLLLTCTLDTSDALAAISCFFQIVNNLVAWTAAVWISAQVVYHFLRRQWLPGGRAIIRGI